VRLQRLVDAAAAAAADTASRPPPPPQAPPPAAFVVLQAPPAPGVPCRLDVAAPAGGLHIAKPCRLLLLLLLLLATVAAAELPMVLLSNVNRLVMLLLETLLLLLLLLGLIVPPTLLVPASTGSLKLAAVLEPVGVARTGPGRLIMEVEAAGAAAALPRPFGDPEPRWLLAAVPAECSRGDPS